MNSLSIESYRTRLMQPELQRIAELMGLCGGLVSLNASSVRQSFVIGFQKSGKDPNLNLESDNGVGIVVIRSETQLNKMRIGIFLRQREAILSHEQVFVIGTVSELPSEVNFYPDKIWIDEIPSVPHAVRIAVSNPGLILEGEIGNEDWKPIEYPSNVDLRSYLDRCLKVALNPSRIAAVWGNQN